MITRVDQPGFLYRQPCSSQNDCSWGSYCNKGFFDVRGVCVRSQGNEVAFAADVQEELNRREEQRRIQRKINEEYMLWWNGLSWKMRAFYNFLYFMFFLAFLIIPIMIHASETKRMRDSMK
jgi:hypothetical protein